ncbi:hypothetical protein AR457_30685 [Streptomyces agglomeratus]|uniref:SHOCT domain-containing protein n=1 Tax=Streptomyces agglomeratus TaxID=285458 RepID=A0A1E5PF78_9ACTN|nr:SHOCT domain-containing protein [Streptomyces agglomeratus]OEJ28190.1 hypothetical protein AS594_30575 [Streptomyces agglomeratus]OEJ37744.1 hypothetical protein BGK70_05960 [Streptomyces agglomeratus]OEJ47869.1 hypothetical protein AR457_30685 [Streptomyces agglomeratus]OEJ50282.1 hypothetical protein BGK72_05480 [Streptomyces agglomeratus]OEJ57609.1 hypothetical protein BGM19_06165 [Streptomyces agglomeratus]
MNTLAHEGPGPWVVFLPLIWAAVAAGVITVLRRTGVRRGWRDARPGPWQQRAPYSESSPIVMLGRRFASGEIDEEEYWRRLSVLDEQFGRTASKGGPA